MEKKIKVEGMMCHNCERHVREALEALPGVESAIADHEANEVTLHLCGEVSDEAVAAAVAEAGYSVSA